MDAAPLLAHILSQTRANVEFLVTQKQVSEADGRDILSKLPKPDAPLTSDEKALVQKTHNLAVSAPSPSVPNPAVTPTYTPSPAIPYQPPLPATLNDVLYRARAAWDYNVSGQNAGDLSFHAGDVIDIIAETNADWWTGRHSGREGLLPSSYVERLPSTQGTPYSEKPPAAGLEYETPAYSSYQPPGGYQGPPPPGQAYSPYGGPQPVDPNASGHTQNPPKKGKFGGKFGDTLAHSAVGGIGFGAGTAIGSGLVNSIF